MLSSPSWLVPGTADKDISPAYMGGLTQFVEAMIAAVRERGFEPADDNEADAIAILLWALSTEGGVA